MTDQDFLHAIRDSPEDGTLRLVYADWLEERGDARSTYLRNWEEMAPLPRCSDRYWGLKAEQRKLQADIAPSWLSEVGCISVYRPLFSKLPKPRQKRWRLVEEFIDLWHSPLTPPDGNTPKEIDAAEKTLGIKLPLALREWYSLAGRRTKIWSRQDYLYPLGELHFIDGNLIFRIENQGCEQWGVLAADLAKPDPPVTRFEEPGIECETITQFAILSLLIETMWVRFLSINDDSAPGIDWAYFKRCDLSDRYWVLNPVHFFEGTELFIVQSHSDSYLYLAARTQAAFENLPFHQKLAPLTDGGQ